MHERHERHMAETNAAGSLGAHENEPVDDDSLWERRVDQSLEADSIDTGGEFDDNEGPSNRWVAGTQQSENESPHSPMLPHSSHYSSQRIDTSFEHSVPFFNILGGSGYITFEANEQLANDNWSFSDEFKKGMKFATK